MNDSSSVCQLVTSLQRRSRRTFSIGQETYEMQEQSFASVLEKYSRYLNQGGDRSRLLALGQRLFSQRTPENADRPSLKILTAKETELAQIPKPVFNAPKPVTKPSPARQEQIQSVPPDQVAEELMVLQDKNALLLARRKTIEQQRDRMNSEYGRLMERSVRQKVHLKLQMQKLKDELAEALSRSKPAFMQQEEVQKARPVMEELTELNDQVLMRINSFKMAINNDKATVERAVLDRYKPQMEQLLGQIYAHCEYLPVSEVLDKFNSISEEIEHEMRDIETEIKNEHERNDQLQREAKQLGEDVAKQEMEVNMLKKQNAQRQRSIQLLKEIAEQEVNRAKDEYMKLLDLNTDEGATPSSARAMIVTTGSEGRRLARNSSEVFAPRKDSAVPEIKTIKEFIADQHNYLQEKIIQQQQSTV